MMFISSLLLFIIPSWFVNIGLNLLYPVKQKYPLVARLDSPIDHGARFWDGRRLIGNSTTLLGVPVALVLSYVIGLIVPIDWIVVFFGAYGGHLIGSFIKRRAGKEDGEYMFFVDHGDAITVTGVILYAKGVITLPVLCVGISATLLLYPAICDIAYRLGLRKYKR